MKQNQIKDLPNLTNEHYENIFNVYLNQDGLYYYNLLQTVIFPQNLPANLFNTYIIKPEDTWPLISYKTLKTPNLWWIIMLANDIRNPILQPKSGTTLLIPIQEIIKEVLFQVANN